MLTNNYLQKISISVPENILDAARRYNIKSAVSSTRIARQIENFILSNTEPKFPIELKHDRDQTIILTKELFDILKDQKLKLLSNFKKTKYERVEIFDIDLKSKIISNLPSSLQDLDIRVSTQEIIGHGMLPHTDFARKCSLFYIFTDSCDWVTSWYKSDHDISTETMKYGFVWPFPNIDDIKLDYQTKIENNTWYLFNNQAYHSVIHNNPNGYRKTLNIEFDNVSFNDILNLINYDHN